ncbi:MAG: 50S ribosomal protein L32 [Calditrichaeota bacterium]|nr:MAG: 50S ribosomal protein L32 [Calditrichota bacterium]
MANPKRKLSRSKRDSRRAQWISKLKNPNFSSCPNCGETKLPHRACPKCGYYKGQKLFEAEE